jgi:hypothetical protein
MIQAEVYMSYFEGECGHHWIGSSGGSYACPICGLHDGDHHLTLMVDIPVQVDDWGTAWQFLREKSEKAFEARMAAEEAEYAQRH